MFSVLGAVLIVMGLYSVLWGKYKEYKEKEEETIQELVKGSTCGDHQNDNNHVCRMATVKEDSELTNDDIEMQKKSSDSSREPKA